MTETLLHREQLYITQWKEFGILFAVFYGPNPWQLPNTPLYIFIMLMFSSIKSEAWDKRSFYVQLTSISSMYIFQSFYSIQSIIAMQLNRQRNSHPDTSMFPDQIIVVSKIFLISMPIKNLPIPTPTQINAWNIATAAIIIRQIDKTFGVIKPGMGIKCHGSNSQQLHILVATKYVKK